MPSPRRKNQSTTLLLTFGLAATLGVLLYFSTTSLPYFAASPTTDPVFGEVNACLLQAAPSARVGFAVSKDAKSAAVWSNRHLVRCSGAVATEWPIAGIAAAAFDGAGRLWAASGAADAGDARLLVFEGSGTPVVRGDTRPAQLVGVDDGIVALEPSGRLISVRGDGAVSGLVDLRAAPTAQLTASGDGQRVALVAHGGLYVFDSHTLEKIRAEASCPVEFLWWSRVGHRAVLSCGPDASWALFIDVDSGHQDTAPDHRRVHSELAGPQGPWVQPCDGLPCTATEPE